MHEPARPRVVIIDDHRLFRSGIAALLRDLDQVDIVGEAEDGQTGIDLVIRERPDVVILDISMKRMSGIEAGRRLRELAPATRVLFLSMHADADYVMEAMRAGGSGYLVKDSATEDLGSALAAVMRGETYVSPAIARHLVAGALHRGAAVEPRALTARQTQILRMIAEGQATKEIAHELGLSVKTVEAHRAQVGERLGIRDVAGLVRHAIRIGLVNVPD